MTAYAQKPIHRLRPNEQFLQATLRNIESGFLKLAGCKRRYPTHSHSVNHSAHCRKPQGRGKCHVAAATRSAYRYCFVCACCTSPQSQDTWELQLCQCHGTDISLCQACETTIAMCSQTGSLNRELLTTVKPMTALKMMRLSRPCCQGSQKGDPALTLWCECCSTAPCCLALSVHACNSGFLILQGQRRHRIPS